MIFASLDGDSVFIHSTKSMGFEDGMVPDDIREAGARDGLHADHPEEFNPDELRRLVEVPDTVEGNPAYRPLQRLQMIWETEIEQLPGGPGKEEIMDAYDKRAQELFAAEIINLPEKDEVENKQYVPVKRLAAISVAIRDFLFARAAAMERMFDLVDKKKAELGLDQLFGPDGITEV